jgi:hypothetical protein
MIGGSWGQETEKQSAEKAFKILGEAYDVLSNPMVPLPFPPSFAPKGKMEARELKRVSRRKSERKERRC